MPQPSEIGAIRRDISSEGSRITAGTDKIGIALSSAQDGTRHATPAEALGMTRSVLEREILPAPFPHKEISGGASLIDLGDRQARTAAAGLQPFDIVHLIELPGAYNAVADRLPSLPDQKATAFASKLRESAIPAIVISTGEDRVKLRGFAKKSPADLPQAPRETWDDDMDGNGFLELRLAYETMAAIYDRNSGAEVGTLLGTTFGTRTGLTSEAEFAIPLAKRSCESHEKPGLVTAKYNFDGKPYEIIDIGLTPEGVVMEQDGRQPVWSTSRWVMEARVSNHTITRLTSADDHRPTDPSGLEVVRNNIAIAGLLRTSQEVAATNPHELGGGTSIVTIAEGMMATIPAIAERVGNGGTIGDAKKIFDRNLGIRR